MKFDYAFFCLKNVVRVQILFKINEKKKRFEFSFNYFLMYYLNVNFGDQNKKQTVQNKTRILEIGKKLFVEYLVEFQQYIKNISSILTINFF